MRGHGMERRRAGCTRPRVTGRPNALQEIRRAMTSMWWQILG